MRLSQTLTGLFFMSSCLLRAFLPRKQIFLDFVSPKTHTKRLPFPAFIEKRHSITYFNPTAVPVSNHLNQSVVRRSAAYFFSSHSKSVLLKMAESHTSSSENTSCVQDEEHQSEKDVKRKESCTELDMTEVRSNIHAEEAERVQMPAHSDQADDKKKEAVYVGLHELQDTEKDTCSQTLTRSAVASEGPCEPAKSSQLSKRAQKKLLRKEKFKEQRKAKRATGFTTNSSPGFDSNLFNETDYYFENGLRKVYPYHFTFSTYAKERWYGRTLQDVFQQEFRMDSPDNFRTQVAKGLLRVNGKVTKLDHMIRNGDLIEHDIHRHENPVTGTPIEILEDTEDVVVINKPASIPCHPCGKFRFNSIVFIMGKELGYANLRNIYRLDRLTSGVLIMGKTARKTKELENHVLHRRVHKEYLARVVGEFPPEEVTVDRPLDCLSHKLTFWQVVEKGGKPSQTTFQRLSYNGQTSLVRCIPHTGRTHQIRVHLQYLGHPIVNDPYYNSPAWGPQRGKGGNRGDLSLEELCQRIMKDHNVGLWYDGENPRFQEHLAKVQASQLPSLYSEDRIAVEKDISDDATVPESDKGSSQDNGQSISEVMPPAKKLRLDSAFTAPLFVEGAAIDDSVQSPELSQSTVPQSPTSQTFVSESPPDHVSSFCGNIESDVVTQTGISDTSEPSENFVPVSKVPVQEMNSSEPAAGQGVKGAEDSANRRSKVVERKGFNPERWMPDPHCESCRLNYINPKPSDLLIYLHALRYKGPGWEYTTKLPDWAADDWQEPQEYNKYLK